jgi:hypothetical protein
LQTKSSPAMKKMTSRHVVVFCIGFIQCCNWGFSSFQSKLTNAAKAHALLNVLRLRSLEQFLKFYDRAIELRNDGLKDILQQKLSAVPPLPVVPCYQI